MEKNSNQKLSMEGNAYLGYRRTNEKHILHDVNKKAKEMHSTCNSTFCKNSSISMCHRYSEDDK